MSESWRYLAFGIELGPMSWDDLRERARRGDLRPDNQVRQGEHGPWAPAGNIPGLFAPSVETRSGDEAWFCEVLGAELGPMSWDDLRLLVQRGSLRADNRVRCGKAGEWVCAARVSGLIAGRASESDADFELAAGLLAAEQALAPPAPGAVEFEVDAPCAAPVSMAAPPNEGKRDESPSIDCSEPTPVAAAAPVAVSASVPSTPVAEPAAARQSATFNKPQQKEGRFQPASRSISLRVPPKLLGAVAASAVLAALSWLGYLMYGRMGTRGPDFRQVATSYQQVYQEIKQFRQDPRSRSPVGLKFQFSRQVAALRQQLQEAGPDSPAAELGQAGSQLSEMLNSFSAQPGSAEALKFVESERQFLAIIEGVK